jgi:4-aminobutyrate aminotransferase-like enzyme
MDRARISRIADQWMIPTSKTAYMAGLESKPVIAAARGVWVIDTEGREYLDFGSGQMAAALGHNHPRYVAAVQRNLQTISHSTKTFLNVDRLELHERLGQILTPPLQKSLFLVSGSDAIEAAIDLARKATGGLMCLVCTWRCTARPRSLPARSLLVGTVAGTGLRRHRPRQSCRHFATAAQSANHFRPATRSA